MTAVRALVVDDEPKIRTMVRRFLEADGFEVSEAGDGESALAAANRGDVDLVLIDVAMPGIDGIEAVRRLRTTSAVPVIFLSARAEEVDQLIGLAVGADDYLAKPFSPRLLIAKCRAVLRRSGEPVAAGDQAVDEPWRFDGITIDRARREVSVGDDLATLTALDFDVLVALALTPGRVLSRGQLIERVWGDDFFGDRRVVDVHVRTLRQALGDDATTPRLIQTVRAVGYRFLPARTA